MKKFENKKLLVLGGTNISCEIVKKAKELGAYVCVTDYNPPEKSPAKRIADESFLVSVTDVDAVVDLIHREHIDGVMLGFADVILPYYADICKKAGLPYYGTREQFEIFINKNKYKALCRKFGVPTVDEYHIDLNNFDTTTEGIVYPVMIKPADSSGARGITICNNKEELYDAFNKAKSFSKSGQILAERYLTGEECTVFWVFADGKYYLTGIGNRHVKHNQEGVIPLPVGYTFPSYVQPKYRKEIEPKVKKMLESVGIKNGMMFMQCKIENDVCIVYDIGFRLTGSLEYKLFKKACGYDPLEMLIEFAFTGKMSKLDLDQVINPDFVTFPFNISYLAKPGKITDLVGIDKIMNQPEVIDAVIAHFPGETITENMKGLLAQITLRVLGSVDSYEQLENTLINIQSMLTIVSDDENNLLLPGFEPGDLKGKIYDYKNNKVFE